MHVKVCCICDISDSGLAGSQRSDDAVVFLNNRPTDRHLLVLYICLLVNKVKAYVLSSLFLLSEPDLMHTEPSDVTRKLPKCTSLKLHKQDS